MAGGTIRKMIARLTTGVIDPGIPCSTRNATRLSRSQANEHSTENAANSTNANRYIRRSPSRAASHAVAGIATASDIRKAVLTQLRSSLLTRKSLPITGSATPMMLESSTDRNIPTTATATGTSQCTRPPCRGAPTGRGSATVPADLVSGAAGGIGRVISRAAGADLSADRAGTGVVS